MSKSNRGNYNREQKLLRRYGLTDEGFKRILYLQGGGCEICGTERDLVVDHLDTENGPVVRGILCRHCNLALGHARHDAGLLRRMISYVNRGEF